MKLIDVTNPFQINWIGYQYLYSSNNYPVPILEEGFAPLLTKMVNKFKDLIIPIFESIEGRNKLSKLLLIMDTCQKYGKDLGNEGALLRDQAFQRILADFPSDIIEESFYEYMNSNSSYPAPFDIKEIASGKFCCRRGMLSKLQTLLEVLPEVSKDEIKPKEICDV